MLTTTATAATGAALDLEAIKGALQGLDELDPSGMLPQMDSIFSRILLVCRICVMLGPVLLLILGLCYLFLAPKEANYYFGYRCFYGMGSVNAWQFTQRMAGIIQASCKHAVKAGDRLTDLEIRSLLEQMTTSGAPPTCPHGRPVLRVMSKYEIERMFKRVQ